MDLTKLGERTIYIDCDVIQADGGTRTASVTGAYAALALACWRMEQRGDLKRDPLRDSVAAISVGIVGGGYIGLELGSVWLRLGAKVSVIEMLPKIATTLDGQVGRKLQRVLKRQGINFHMQTKVTDAKIAGKSVRVDLETKKGRESLSCNRLLISVGRRPRTTGLGLEEVGLKTDPDTGQVLVDASYRTNIPGIYTAGDVAGGFKQIVTAAGQGSEAATVVFEDLIDPYWK